MPVGTNGRRTSYSDSPSRTDRSSWSAHADGQQAGVVVCVGRCVVDQFVGVPADALSGLARSLKQFIQSLVDRLVTSLDEAVSEEQQRVA